MLDLDISIPHCVVFVMWQDSRTLGKYIDLQASTQHAYSRCVCNGLGKYIALCCGRIHSALICVVSIMRQASTQLYGSTQSFSQVSSVVGGCVCNILAWWCVCNTLGKFVTLYASAQRSRYVHNVVDISIALCVVSIMRQASTQCSREVHRALGKYIVLQAGMPQRGGCVHNTLRKSVTLYASAGVVSILLVARIFKLVVG